MDAPRCIGDTEKIVFFYHSRDVLCALELSLSFCHSKLGFYVIEINCKWLFFIAYQLNWNKKTFNKMSLFIVVYMRFLLLLLVVLLLTLLQMNSVLSKI